MERNCGEQNVYACTRRQRHTGQHEARGMSDRLIKAWPQKESPMEYKSLKLITLERINKSGVPYDCCKFKQFVKSVVEITTCYAWGEIPHEIAQKTLLSIKPDSTWFLDHGFIERVQGEKFWKRGDRVVDGNEYIIGYCGGDRNFGLINVKDGCLKHDITRCKTGQKITLSEMRQMGYKGE